MEPPLLPILQVSFGEVSKRSLTLFLILPADEGWTAFPERLATSAHPMAEAYEVHELHDGIGWASTHVPLERGHGSSLSRQVNASKPFGLPAIRHGCSASP